MAFGGRIEPRLRSVTMVKISDYYLIFFFLSSSAGVLQQEAYWFIFADYYAVVHFVQQVGWLGIDFDGRRGKYNKVPAKQVRFLNR